MKNLFSVLLLACGMLLFSLSTQAQEDQGKALFQKKLCFACHGPGKKGGDLALSKLDKAAIDKLLKDPKSANPKATMPAFKGTDAERAALVDYVMCLRK